MTTKHFKHYLQPANTRPVYHHPRQMASNHNEVVQEKIEKTLDAGIIVPVSSAWSFCVVFTRKTNGKP